MMSKDKNLRKNGFTLLELLIVMGLMALVLAVAATVQMSGLKSFRRETGVSMSRSSLELASTDITRSLRNSLPEDVGVYPDGLAADGNIYQCKDGALYKNNAWLAGSITALSSDISGKQVTVTLTLASGDVQELVVALRR